MAIGGLAATATDSGTSISQTNGVAAFATSSGITLADALNDIATRFTAATDTAGDFAFFKVNSTDNNYIFISNGVAGVGTNDVVVHLSDITAISNINLTNGHLTILG